MYIHGVYFIVLVVRVSVREIIVAKMLTFEMFLFIKMSKGYFLITGNLNVNLEFGGSIQNSVTVFQLPIIKVLNLF